MKHESTKATVSPNFAFSAYSGLKCLIFECEGKRGDVINLNEFRESKLDKILLACQYPSGKDAPSWTNKLVWLGDPHERIKRTMLIVGV